MTSHRMTALSIIAVYWMMLVLGMASCLALRSDASIAAIWTGTVAGTALGHGLALLNTRTWFALLSIITVAIVVGPSAPGELSGSTLWLAFVPAAVCAFWSLGDRTTLVAFWFPVVIWMLSVLDRTQANGIPDGTGIALLGVLAVLFVLFLRVRETRRVALWRSVTAAPMQLAQPRPSVTLKERPGFRMPRAAWALIASAAAFGATAWLAPRLWQPESLAGDHQQVATRHTHGGLPCCPVEAEVDTPRTRVKEYFAVGRGHDETPVEQPARSCRRCEGARSATVAPRIERPYLVTTYTTSDPWEVYAEGPAYQPPLGERYATGMPAGDPTADVGMPTADVGVPTTAGSIEPLPQVPAPSPRGSETPTPPPAVTPPPPVEATPSVPPVEATPSVPPVEATQTPPPVESKRGEPMPSEPPPSTVTAPLPDPEPAQPTGEVVPEPQASRRPVMTIAPSLLQWIGVLLAAAALLQLAALALRPLRRWVTLRHLRKPFWDETVDQRVSNAWQLALVGLRDAGWRADSQESPRELARRVGIDDVERCATILERARHGIGIDAEDLATMTSSAESAYRDARGRLGPVARATTWLRWPLT